MRKPALRSCAFTAAALLGATLVPQAQSLYSENFDANTGSDWTVNAGTANDRATFLFDYGAVGIPAAPNSSGTTLGVRLQANRLATGGGTLSGVSISPTGKSFTGDYELRYDSWQNFNGPFPGGGNGSTQMTGGGIMTAGNVAHFAGAGDGLWFVGSGDGGTTSDYRVYNKGINQGTTGTGVTYAANSQSNSDPFYTANFGGASAPAAQLALFAQQNGATAAGSLGMAWHDVTVTKVGNIVTWKIDGNLIATVDITTLPAFGGTDILFAQSDINATSSTDPNADALLFGLIDNVRVTAVPEPSTYALMGTSGLLLLGFLRRRK